MTDFRQIMLNSGLDAADVRILESLQRAGRLTNVELASQVGLSPSPCLRRVRDLEEAGFITGYAAQLDRRKLGFGVHAFVEIKIEQNVAAGEAFRRAIAAMPEVISCFVMSGTLDYLVQVVARDLDDYAELFVKRLWRLPGIKDMRSSFVLDAVKHAAALPVAAADARAAG